MHEERRAQTVSLPRGRQLDVGSRWRCNDPRRFAIIEVVRLDVRFRKATCRNVVTGKETKIGFDAFTIGVRGWSRE